MAIAAGEKDINAHPSERTVLIPKHGDAARVELDDGDDALPAITTTATTAATATTPVDRRRSNHNGGWFEQMKDAIFSLYVALGVLTYVVLFILACIELYNGQRYRYEDRGCDQPDGRLFSVKTWLWIDGIVSIVAINAALGAVASGIFPGNTGLVALFIVIAAYSLFVVAWSIPGFIQLVEYSKACRVSDHHLWNVAMAAIVVHWVLVVVNSVFAVVSVFQTGGVTALISPLSSSSSSSSCGRCNRRCRRSCRRCYCHCRCCCRSRQCCYTKPAARSRITSTVPTGVITFSPLVFEKRAAVAPVAMPSSLDKVGDDIVTPTSAAPAAAAPPLLLPPRQQGRRRSKKRDALLLDWQRQQQHQQQQHQHQHQHSLSDGAPTGEACVRGGDDL